MAWIPGGFINGKFKTFDQMSIEELEEFVTKSKVRALLILGFSMFFTLIILFVIGVYSWMIH